MWFLMPTSLPMIIRVREKRYRFRGARQASSRFPLPAQSSVRGNRYVFFAAFASAFFLAAHRWRILSDAAFLWAALKVRPPFFGAGALGSRAAFRFTGAAEVATVGGFFGGRPWRLVGP